MKNQKAPKPPLQKSTLSNCVPCLLAFLLVKSLLDLYSVLRQEPSIYRTVKRDHTLTGSWRERGGEIKWLSTSHSTGLLLFSQWPRCEQPPFSCTMGHPDLPCRPFKWTVMGSEHQAGRVPGGKPNQHSLVVNARQDGWPTKETPTGERMRDKWRGEKR